MILSPQQSIARYTAEGWWGTDTLWTLVAATIRKAPQREAVVDPPDHQALCGSPPLRLTYAELARHVEHACAQFLDVGLGPDDRILVQLPNVHEAIVVLLACARMGIIVSPVPMQYRQHELAALVALLEPRLGITVSTFKGFGHAELFDALLPRDAPILLVGAPPGPRFATFDPAQPRSSQRPLPPEPTANDIFTICWTSGTEGVPRGVPRSHNHWIANARYRECNEREVILSGFPMVNMAAIGGAFAPWCLSGGKLVLHHPFDLDMYLGQVERERVTCTSFPPTILDRIAADPSLATKFDLSSLHTVHTGAAPLSPAALQRLQESVGIAVTNVFASNEGAAFNSGPDRVADPQVRARLFPAEHLGPDNRLRMLIESRLVDPETGRVIEEPGVPAELQIRGPTVFHGYWRVRDDESFTADGWFRTGDILQIEYPLGEQRFLRFVSRRKELIVRGGFKIAPSEIDHLLDRSPEVAQAVTVGVPDPEVGERICVAVVPKPGATPTVDSLSRHLLELGLARIKLPERVLIVDAIPRNPLGKPMRSAVRALFEQSRTP